MRRREVSRLGSDLKFSLQHLQTMPSTHHFQYQCRGDSWPVSLENTVLSRAVYLVFNFLSMCRRGLT